MGCFCQSNVAALAAATTLQPGVSMQLAATIEIAGAARLQAMADWLSLRALPAPVWQPDPAWLSLALPEVALSASAVGTLAALAQLKVAAAALGLDVALASPALPRVVATIAARLPSLVPLLEQSAAVASLCRLDEAATLVLAAAAQGLFTLSAATEAAFAAPGGIELAQWLPWLDQLRALGPLVALALQFGVSLTAEASVSASASLAARALSASLAAAIRPLLALSLTPLGDATIVARLLSQLALRARLQASLGAEVMAGGVAAIEAAVSAKVALALAAVPPGARPPRIALAPANFATPAMVRLATSPRVAALASLQWQVPSLAALPSLGIGLNACMLAQMLGVVLGTPAVLASPCPVCDAAAVLRAARAA